MTPPLSRERALQQAEEGTPRFVYDGEEIRERVARVRAALPDVSFLYASKANAFPPLLQLMAEGVDGVDVTSRGALESAIESGFAPSSVQYTSPGKSADDLRAAVETGATVVVGGRDEAVELHELAPEHPAMLRVNPVEKLHAFRSATGGVPSPFGVPEEEVAGALAVPLPWAGLHVHRGSQCTSRGALLRHVNGTLQLAERLHREHGLPLHVNLGGGWGVPPRGGEPLDLEAMGRQWSKALAAFLARWPGARFAVEPGRWLVGEAGTLLLRVLRVRTVRGTTFVVLDGGIDTFLFASERMRHGPPPPIRNLSHPDGAPTPVTLVGPACTGEDTLVRDLVLPRCREGDVLAIDQAGAYAARASVRGFLGRCDAEEVLV